MPSLYLYIFTYALFPNRNAEKTFSPENPLFNNTIFPHSFDTTAYGPFPTWPKQILAM